MTAQVVVTPVDSRATFFDGGPARTALARLQAEVSAGLAAAGVYVPEARAFRPHVTVGRLRTGARAPGRVDAAPDRLAFAAHAVTLYRSHLARAGASYEALFTREL
jgi:2'-5' RNA ligase